MLKTKLFFYGFCSSVELYIVEMPTVVYRLVLSSMSSSSDVYGQSSVHVGESATKSMTEKLVTVYNFYELSSHVYDFVLYERSIPAVTNTLVSS